MSQEKLIIKGSDAGESLVGVESNGAIVCLECKAPNPGSRKFCGKCGEHLWQNCTNCETENPVSDAFCGSCGDDLSKVLRENQDVLIGALAVAKEKAKELDFNGAISALNSVKGSAGVHIKSQRDQIEEQLNRYRKRHDEIKSDAKEKLEKANFYWSKNLFVKSLQVLKQIPEKFRTAEALTLIAQASQKENEARRLHKEIETLIAKKKVLDALPKIEMLIRLRPHDKTLPSLAKDITHRLLKKVKQLQSQGHFADAYQLIKTTNSDSITETTAAIKEDLKETVWLTKYVHQAQRLDANLLAVIEYLAKKTSCEVFQKLLDDANERMQLAAQKRITQPEWARAPDQTAVGVPVKISQAIRQIENIDLVSKNGHDQNCFAVAIGLAFAGLGKAKVEINLNKNIKRGFLGLGRMKFAKTAWGVDFGQSAMKVVRLALSDNGIVTIDRCDLFPYRSSHGGLSGNEQKSNLLEAIIQFKSKHQVAKDDSVSASLSSNQVLRRFLLLPNADEKITKAALEHEVQLQIPFAADEIVWDRFVMQSGSDGKRLAMIAAAKKPDVQRISELFTANGMKLSFVQPEAVAIANYYAHESMGNAENKTVAILDIGYEASNFCVIGPDRIWFRSFSIGGSSFTRVIAKALRETNEIAELRKTSLKSAGGGIGKAVAAMHGPYEELLAEISRSLWAYQNDLNSPLPSELICTGGASRTAGLLTYLRHGARSLSIA